MRALAASAYVESLDMADRVPENLQRLRLWADGDQRADDWSRFTEYVLNCEGIALPSREDVCARERLTRSILSDLLLTDARKQYPLGAGRVASYDLLISAFCVECLSASTSVWRRCTRNVFGLLKPGGSFVIVALRGSEGYRVGADWFRVANIQLGELRSLLLECDADPSHLKITESDLPNFAVHGYTGILMASGQTVVHDEGRVVPAHTSSGSLSGDFVNRGILPGESWMANRSSH
jgi:hypothetical protein